MTVLRPAPGPSVATPPSRRPRAGDGRELEIMLVEDSTDWAELVEDSLRQRWFGRHRLQRYETLAECVAALERSDPSCILLDLSLPDADGLEAVDALQRQAPDVPLVVLTGNEDDERAVEAVRRGAQDYLLKRAFDGDGLTRAIQHAIERKRSELELARGAFYDELTGLPNRRLLTDRLTLACARLQRNPQALIAVLFIDIDDFKSVNDKFGHDTGDRVLMEVAERIRSVLRPADTTARLGGDEFVVLCEELRGESSASSIAHRLAAAIARPMDLDGQELTVTASIGLALGSGAHVSPEALLGEADGDMYRAKRLVGRLGAPPEEVSPPPPAGAASREVMRELRSAVDGGRLLVAYQPIVRLADRSVARVEALVRWRRSDQEFFLPARLIPMAQAGGFMDRIDRFVLEASAAQVVEWNRMRPDSPVGCSVNLSVEVLRDDCLPDRVAEILESAELAPQLLTVELTEGAVLAGEAIDVIGRLGRVGVRIALDDFGAGYSSHASLVGLPLDELKLDRSLVAEVDRDPRAEAVVEAALGLADRLELQVVAEGVEREAQAVLLQALGCTTAQGYLFGRPERADSISDLRWPLEDPELLKSNQRANNGARTDNQGESQ